MASQIDLSNLSGGRVVRRLTRRHGYEGTSAVTGNDRSILFVIRHSSDASSLTATTANFPVVDQIGNVGANTKGALIGGSGASGWPLEGESDMGEIDIKVDSIPITAATKKLKAKWTPELGQDLNAYHNLDAEVELTSILSEQIALEIDREILQDLVRVPLLVLITGVVLPASLLTERLVLNWAQLLLLLTSLEPLANGMRL